MGFADNSVLDGLGASWAVIDSYSLNGINVLPTLLAVNVSRKGRLRRDQKIPTLFALLWRQGGCCPSRLLLIADGGRGPIELRDVDGERLVVAAGTVLQDGESHLLTH